MVTGIDKFREHFAEHVEQYALIGGAACDRKADGVEVKDKDIKKHRNDVFRLLQLIAQDQKVQVAQPISADLSRFVASVENDENINPKAFGVNVTRTEALQLLKSAYGLGG